MPGMDGLRRREKYARLLEDTMIIIITAYDWSSIEQEAREAGANYFISKPVFQSTIRDTSEGSDSVRLRSMQDSKKREERNAGCCSWKTMN